MTALSRVFREQKEKGNGTLIGYIMSGDPAPMHTRSLADAMVSGGVDILELGIPFSDPIADGPTIQAANTRALKAGATLRSTMKLAKEIKELKDVPLVLLTYYNPIFRMGLDSFFDMARDCMVDGVVVPDLPIEEAAYYVAAARKYSVDTIFLAAPSTSPDRLRKIIDHASGFLYLVSHFGVTGERARMAESTIPLIKKALQFTSNRIPLAVGFGVSKPEHARSIIQAGAKGAIVGSAFVNIIQRNQSDIYRMLEEIGGTAREFKEALHDAL